MPLDSRRLDMLLRARAAPTHPFSQFTTGNRQTLRGGDEEARAALLAFHRQYYRAPQMALSLMGPQSLDELQALAESRFAQVGGGGPTSQPASAAYDALPPPFVPGSTTALQVAPVRDVRSVTLTWCVPIGEFDENEWARTKPEQILLIGLLASRAEGAPLPYLKREGLASAVEGRVELLTRSFLLLSVYIGMTELGLSRWGEVASVVFSYLRALREGGVPRHTFAEARDLSQLSFAYAEPPTPRSFVVSGTWQSHGILTRASSCCSAACSKPPTSRVSPCLTATRPRRRPPALSCPSSSRASGSQARRSSRPAQSQRSPIF